MIAATALLCLSLNLYHESRSESIPGQYAVALVTLNRADRDRSRVCQEVFKPKQFSWANKGVRKVRGGWELAKQHTPTDPVAWALAQRIAAWSLAGKMPDFTGGSKFYHTVAVKPIWRLALVQTKKIGQHKFYRQG